MRFQHTAQTKRENPSRAFGISTKRRKKWEADQMQYTDKNEYSNRY